MRRYWDLARQKVERERVCRVCRSLEGELRTKPYPHVVQLEAAHVIGRSNDPEVESVDLEALTQGELTHQLAREGGYTHVVHPDDVVPLCSRCHKSYDRRTLVLLPYLSLAEQSRAALLVGLERALRRTCPGQSRS